MKKIVSLLLVAILALSAVSALAYEYDPHKGDLGGVQAAILTAALNHDGTRTGKPFPTVLVWQANPVNGGAPAFDSVAWAKGVINAIIEQSNHAGTIAQCKALLAAIEAAPADKQKDATLAAFEKWNSTKAYESLPTLGDLAYIIALGL